MPKIKDLIAGATNKDSNDIRFLHSYTCHVTTDGNFQVTLPEDQIAGYSDLLTKREDKSVQLTISPRSGNTMLVSNELARIQKVCNEYARFRVEAETTEELRIFYDTTSNCHYVREDATGEVFPSNEFVPENAMNNTHHWQQHKSRKSPSHHWPDRFEVGVGARILRVVTIKHADTEAVEYKRADLPEGSEGWRLNQFHCNLTPSVNKWGQTSDIKSVPYTEETAKVFADTLYALCRLTEGMERFFGDEPETLLENIRKGVKMLPGPAGGGK